MDLRIVKRALRQEMRLKRHDAKAETTDAASRLRDCFMHSIPLPPQSVVAAYQAFEDEMDPSPLLAALAQAGHPLCLPVVTGKNTSLIFRAYKPGDRLEPGTLRILEPLPSQPELTPDILLVPLLAFDRKGHRLGYGGGFYDRTLSLMARQQHPILTYGLAYAAQEIEAVPVGRYDRRLNGIITEIEAFLPKDKAALTSD